MTTRKISTRRIPAEELKAGRLLASACLPSERHPDHIPVLEAADMLTEPCSACGASVGASCDVTTRGARGATIVDGIGSTAGAGAGVGVGVVRGWSTRCFYDIGFSHGTLVESYIEIFDRWAGKAPEKLLHILSSTTFVLLHWTRCVAE